VALVITIASLAACLSVTWLMSRGLDSPPPKFQVPISSAGGAASDKSKTLHGSGAIEMDGEPTQSGFRRGPGKPGIPPHVRWVIEVDEGTTIDAYAQVLDCFKIELGVLGAGKVTFLNDLTKPTPVTRSGPARDERRLYMSSRNRNMREAEQELVRRASVANSRVVLQFFSEELERMLLNLEREYQGRDPSQIRKTHFCIRHIDGRYEFYVADQTPL
jgi:hypothetical protein